MSARFAHPALAALWAQIPDSNCRGLCQESCANVACSLTERETLWHATGTRLPDPLREGITGPCPLLDRNGRCSAYEQRPLICRMYGSVEGLPCPHGCRPTFGPIPDAAARELLQQAEHLPPEAPVSTVLS